MSLLLQFYACDWCDGVVAEEWDKPSNEQTDELEIDWSFVNPAYPAHKLVLPPYDPDDDD